MSTFSVNGVSTSPTRLDTTARQFSFVIDEPPALGGTDEGANPVEYVLGAFAGCLNVVVNLVAQERGVTVNSLRFDVSGDLDPAKVLGQQTNARAGFSDIRVAVHLDADTDAETIASIIEEAKGRCPVSDNLANPTPVSISIAEPALSN